jgi:hypothetical protein
MAESAKAYLAVMPNRHVEFSIEGPLVGGAMLHAFYMTEDDAVALHAELGAVLADIRAERARNRLRIVLDRTC